MEAETHCILVVDDDAAVGEIVGDLVRQAGYAVRLATNANAALDLLRREPIDLVLSDVRMPGMDGMQLLAAVRERWEGVPIVLMSAHATVPLAVDAMKRGAADFVTKPFDRDELLFVIGKVLEQSTREATPPDHETDGDELLGVSEAMNECRSVLRRVATSDASVLLLGESGTGKELAARAIHRASPRKDGPFVPIHCAALPETLLESELFGYEKGAFTGAATRKPGRVELAHKGTLFLDEVGDISLAMQVKLLRLVQEREFQRVGGTKTERIDVRFVAATHKDLAAMVRAGTFREDLFFRLNVVPVRVPPLRERADDVDVLAKAFCARLGAANRRTDVRLDPSALASLRAHRWPGNVRELQNFVERLVVMSESATITAEDVARERARFAAFETSSAPAAPKEGSLDDQRRATEKEALRDALARSGNNRTVAARILGVSRRTLYTKLAEHGIA